MPFPALSYPDWEPTKTSLHLFAQIVGKIRMACHPKLNHWWHVTLYPHVDGLTTGFVPNGGAGFALTLDLRNSVLAVHGPHGEHRTVPLSAQSVASFYQDVMATLAGLGITPRIIARPYDMPFDRPFSQMTDPAPWDAEAAAHFHRAVLDVASVFEAFRGDFWGKQTPVQLYWHSFDLVVTQFSGRRAPPREGTNSDKEAYSHEVISYGFWPGDAQTREPMFYTYTYPEPDGLKTYPLAPGAASWTGDPGGVMGLMPYEAVRMSDDPQAALLAFLRSAYAAGSAAAGWETDTFRRLDAGDL